jgi:predicted dehydrogenase
MKNSINRRKFIKDNTTLITGIGLAGSLPVNAFSMGPGIEQKARFGFIGTGNRGRGLMGNILSIEGVEIKAVCDIDPIALEAAKKIVMDHGQPKPEAYPGDTDYLKLVQREDIDAVIIATPWDLHTPMAIAGMKAGKYTCCEVPIAYTLDECLELIKTHEATGTECMMMENWSFRPDNLAVLNMIRSGLLGTMTHAHCAYSHDCIDHWYFDSATGNDRWGARYLLEHNRNQYPTHQQGPVLSWLNIGCGDYYDTLTSTATDCFSINEYYKRRFPGHPNGDRKYKQGDIVTTVVRTKLGKTVVINFDMQSPRPYDNRWTVQGTKGIYNEQRNSVYLTGVSPQYHQWEPFPPYQEKYENRLAGDIFGGHGGADGIMPNQIVKSVKNKTKLPLSLYDGVLMSSIGPLSEKSIAGGSKKLDVPDFMSGRWKTSKPYFAL